VEGTSQFWIDCTWLCKVLYRTHKGWGTNAIIS